MANQGFNTEALDVPQADDLRKLIKILKVLAAARTSNNPPHTPPTPALPANITELNIHAIAGQEKEEAILW